MSEQALRQEIADLRARVEQVDDWANSVHAALRHVALQLAYSSPQAAAGLLAVLEHDALGPPDSADPPARLASSRRLYEELGASLRQIASEQSAQRDGGS
jgi:hypothetical protein